MIRLGDIVDLGGADAFRAGAPSPALAADSRKVAPGDVFFALAGAKDDGLKHAAEAVGARRGRHRRRARGADRRRAGRRGSPTPAPRWRAPRRGSIRGSPETIVAVTGTSGKTSVAAFVRQIWAGARARIGLARHDRRRLAPADGLWLADHARTR